MCVECSVDRDNKEERVEHCEALLLFGCVITGSRFQVWAAVPTGDPCSNLAGNVLKLESCGGNRYKVQGTPLAAVPDTQRTPLPLLSPVAVQPTVATLESCVAPPGSRSRGAARGTCPVTSGIYTDSDITPSN